MTLIDFANLKLKVLEVGEAIAVVEVTVALLHDSQLVVMAVGRKKRGAAALC